MRTLAKSLALLLTALLALPGALAVGVDAHAGALDTTGRCYGGYDSWSGGNTSGNTTREAGYTRWWYGCSTEEDVADASLSENGYELASASAGERRGSNSNYEHQWSSERRRDTCESGPDACVASSYRASTIASRGSGSSKGARASTALTGPIGADAERCTTSEYSRENLNSWGYGWGNGSNSGYDRTEWRYQGESCGQGAYVSAPGGSVSRDVSRCDRSSWRDLRESGYVYSRDGSHGSWERRDASSSQWSRCFTGAREAYEVNRTGTAADGVRVFAEGGYAHERNQYCYSSESEPERCYAYEAAYLVAGTVIVVPGVGTYEHSDRFFFADPSTLP